MEETKNEMRLKIWRNMTPEQRDYDRFVGKIPFGASWSCETEEGQKNLEERRESRGMSVYEEGCSCHICPPCNYCIRKDNDELE
jgi:hypothetical protein